MKIKLLAITILAFMFVGCSGFRLSTPETYAKIYDNIYDVNRYVYIDYEFNCSNCYYEMYWCFNCQTYHVRVSHFCPMHNSWYLNWYRPHYFHPYGYYSNHYRLHTIYRDNNRVYIRDHNGLRNLRGMSNNVYGTKNYNNNRNNDIIKYKDNRKNNTYQRPNNNNTQRNKTYQRPNNNNTQRNKTYQRPNNTQKRETTKQDMRKNSGSRMKKR